MPYAIQFDFDAEDDPPKVYLIDEHGTAHLEVFEEPTCTHPSGWSWEEDDWTPGELALRVLALLNA